MGNSGVKSKDMDRQEVLLKGNGNLGLSAASCTCCFCAFTRSLARLLTHSLTNHSFETEPRYSTGLHASQYVDKACLKRQRFASALSAGIKCMPPCPTSPGITTVHLGDSFGLITIVPIVMAL